VFGSGKVEVRESADLSSRGGVGGGDGGGGGGGSEAGIRRSMRSRMMCGLMVHLRDFLNCNKLSKQSSNMPYFA